MTQAEGQEQPRGSDPEREAPPGESQQQEQAEQERQEPGLSELAAEWVEAVGGRIRTSADLVLAETKLALSTFLFMIFLAILAAGAVLFAWGFLMLALARIPTAFGVPPSVSALVMFGIHLLLAFVLWRIANGLSRHMEFRATRQMFAARADIATEEKTDES